MPERGSKRVVAKKLTAVEDKSKVKASLKESTKEKKTIEITIKKTVKKKEEVGSPDEEEEEVKITKSKTTKKAKVVISDDEDDFEPPLKKIKGTPKKKMQEVAQEVDVVIPVLPADQQNKRADMKIGAHLSISEGLDKVPALAVSVGATAFAIFTGSQRQWERKIPTDEVAKAFKEACKKHKFSPDVILPHGSYLINLGSPEDDKLEKSRDLFLKELQVCEKLGLTLYNFHPGSHKSQITVDQSLARVAESINIAHKQTSKVITVIENTAGAGDTIGHTFEQIGKIIAGVKDKTRVGVCLDTCHMFAAGYDIATAKGFLSMMESFEKEVGFQYLKGMHLNDSKQKLASRADRHESIGKGFLGNACFKRFLNDPRLKGIPMILETVGPYEPEIKLLYSLLDSEKKK